MPTAVVGANFTLSGLKLGKRGTSLMGSPNATTEEFPNVLSAIEAIVKSN